MKPLLLLILLFSAAAAGDTAAAAALPAQGCKIAHLYFNGNKTTREEVIRAFLKIDTGIVYDTAKARLAKQRLMATNLFLKADLVPLVKSYGVDLYVILKEPPYVNLSALDFTPNIYRYGKRGFWVCPTVGVDVSNIRGRMETVRLTVRAWDWRTVALGWSKPLFPSNYFIGVGAFADSRPDNMIHLDRTEYAGSLTFGKRCFDRSKVFCSVMPDYQRKITWTDSGVDTANYYQAFASAGWFTDRRSSIYDPSQGWSFFFETRSNAPYHEAAIPTYVQFSTDLRWYHAGFVPSHKVAYHTCLITRTDDAGIQNRLTLGSISNLRGYGIGGIDLRTNTNASFVLSTEYRFPIVDIQYLTRFIPAWFLNASGRFGFDLSSLSPRIDGAFFVDYGKIGRWFENIVSYYRPGYITGTDIGFGLRLMEKTMRISGCLDIVWVENPNTRGLDFLPMPGAQLYLNLPF